jgi:uncharacterized ion transporter superfamily protein YfcC
MPSAFSVLMLITLVVAGLTWIVPAGQYQTNEDGGAIAGTYESIAQNPQGAWEVVQAPLKGFTNALDVCLFVIVIGGFLGIVMKTGAIDAGIGSLIKKLKGRESIMIPILMTVFALGGSTYGMAEETIAFYPILIPIFIAAGYDALVAVAVILLGAGVGVLASTVNPFATGVASGIAGVSVGDGMLFRVVMLVVVLVAAIFYVMKYAAKVKADPSKSLIADKKEENEKHFLKASAEEMPELTGKRKAVNTLFIITFIIMIMGVMPWEDFGVTFFGDMNAKLAALPILGGTVQMGWWWFTELAMLFLVSGVIIGIVGGLKEEEISDSFVAGAKDLLGVALIIGTARGISVVMDAGGMTATVLNMGEVGLSGMSSVLFTNLAFLFYIPMSFLIPSTSGLATLSMPIMAPLAGFADVSSAMIITAFQSAEGIVNLLTPTSGVVMGALALGRVSYGKWLKFVMPFIIILMVVVMAMLTAGVSLGM